MDNIEKNIYKIHEELPKGYGTEELKKALEDENTQISLRAINRDWIDRGETQQRNEGMPEKWWRDKMYKEGYHEPVGFKSQTMADFAETHKFVDTDKYRLKKDADTGKVYVVDNKMGDLIKGIIGDYTSVKKDMTVEYDDISTNDAIEYATKKSLEWVQDKSQFMLQVFTPCIEGFATMGLYWYTTRFNTRTNIDGGGMVEFDYYDPADVFPDPQARKKYFMDARWVVRKKKVTMSEAEATVKRIKQDIREEDIKPDSDYYSIRSEYHNNISNETDEHFITLYTIEYKIHDIRKVEKEGTMVDEEITRYFKMTYNTNLGVIDWQENYYVNVVDKDSWQFDVIPFYNEKNWLRQYPNSDIEKLSMVQDLINMSETLLLDNARQRNLLRLIVRQSLYDNYQEEFEEFVKNGGILPISDEDIKNAFAPATWQELPAQFYQFMDMMKASFQEHGSQNAILQGAYPKGGSISGPIINGLQEQRSKHYSYKAQNIEWAMQQGMMKIFRMIATEWTEENFLKITQRTKEDPKYIPINAMLTFEEYAQLLQKAYPGMEPAQADEKFRKRNEVAIFFPKELNNGFMVNRHGRLITNADEVAQAESFVFVNMLSLAPADKIDIRIKLDWDYEQNREKEEMKAIEFFKGGVITKKRLLQNSGDKWREEADEICEEKEAEDKVIQMGQMVTQAGPEWEQKVMQDTQQYMAGQKGKGGSPTNDTN